MKIEKAQRLKGALKKGVKRQDSSQYTHQYTENIEDISQNNNDYR